MNYYDAFIKLLLENKPLLLFLVIAIGYFIGRIKIAGFSFGVAAVLFVGLAFGALHPDMALPDMIYILGLVLFVYTIGLRSGASFFASFKKSGLRDNLLVIGILTVSAALTSVLGKWMGLKSTLTAGLFCGSLTNTPALASVVDILKHSISDPASTTARDLLAEPVVGYSLAYPIGVMGVIFLFQMGIRFWKIDFKKEAAITAEITGVSTEELEHINVFVTQSRFIGRTLREIGESGELGEIIVSRRLPYGSNEIEVPGPSTLIKSGDTLTLVGLANELERYQSLIGIPTGRDLSLDASTVAVRRIFVSNKAVIGKRIRDLKLYQQFNGIITRIRRGDVDLPRHPDLTLEAGDRVRIIAPKEHMKEISTYLGDSYQKLSEVDYISISIGIALGLLLGMLPVPLPGGSTFHLGFAAGPLIVALILGKLGRSGRIVWVMSLNANLTLRQMGAVFFLAGIGLKAGYSFYSTFQTAGFQLIILGAIVTLVTALLGILLFKLVFKMPYNLLLGVMSALHTQPACLAFANEKDDTGAANIGYATVFPTAMVVKILLAQVILGW
ncbi:MAG: transporter [Saprospiraceae bacterium]|nr:transporter [Saprospiraceae bacterium]